MTSILYTLSTLLKISQYFNDLNDVHKCTSLDL